MKIIFILLLIGLCLISYQIHENFDDTFITKYNNAMKFYNSFMPNYIQAITTSWGLAQSTPTNTQPTNDQLNTYIQTLSKKEGKPFPPVTDLLPTVSTMDDIIKIQAQLPVSAEPYGNALQWMNTNLQKAQDGMKDALKGISGFIDWTTYESFDVCQQIQQCQQAQTVAQTVDIVKTYGPVFDALIGLQSLLDENNRLIAKSKAIQDQAQSGALLPKQKPRVSPYTIPPGKSLSPENEKNYKDNYSQFYAMKKMFDGINGALR